MKKLLDPVPAEPVRLRSAYAADDGDTPNSQQTKMKACQPEATDKKLGRQARQDYVNNCLQGKACRGGKAESKMAMCNEKTKGMSKPDADKARSECMKAT